MKDWIAFFLAAIAFSISWKVALGIFMVGIIIVLADIRDLLSEDMSM